MAVTSFATLQTAIERRIARSRTAAQMSEYTAAVESKFHHGCEDYGVKTNPLRIRAMETSADITLSAQSVALPTDFLQARRVYLNTTNAVGLGYYPPMDFWSKDIASRTGPPTDYTIEGDNIVFGPGPASADTVKMLYYKKMSAIDASTTNWVLLNAAEVYLNGVLAEAFQEMRNDEQAQIHYLRFRGSINSLNSADKLDRASGAPLIMRAGTNP